MNVKGARVRVLGLVSAAEYNGKSATVVQPSSDDTGDFSSRIKIMLDESGKELRVKQVNLQKLTVDDALQNLTITQLKELVEKQVGQNAAVGTDKSELMATVKNKCSEEAILTCGKWENSSQNNLKVPGINMTQSEMEQMMSNPQFKKAQEEMRNMNSNELKSRLEQQRAALRNNPALFDQIVQTNPQMRGMTREQVLEQLDLMAGVDPEQLKAMANLDQQFASSNGKQTLGVDAQRMEEMQKAVGNMDAKQLKKMMESQRSMIKNNPAMIEQLRKSNPQMASLSNQQIESQLEMMCNMDDEQFEAIMKMQKQATSLGSSGSNSTGFETGVQAMQEQIRNMDPKQMASVLKLQKDMMEKNPDMFDKMIESNPMMKGIPKDMLKKQLDAMSQLPPEQLEQALKLAGKVQAVTEPISKAYRVVDGVTGGNAKIIFFAIIAIFIGFLIDRYILRSA